MNEIPQPITMRKPPWLKKKMSLNNQRKVKAELRSLNLHSVCEEASCPNISECFAKGVATVMIMGDVCTRTCKFCNVKSGRPPALDPNEPKNVANWIKAHGYKHIVITSVDRDDLKNDLGSTHFAAVIRESKALNPNTSIEVLTPDFQGRGDCIDRVCAEQISVFNHNLETIERLTAEVRSASDYRRSLGVIAHVKKHHPHIITKSGMMLGLGESRGEVFQAMKDLRDSGCDMLTLGQYLQPSPKHLPVTEFIHPDIFDEHKQFGLDLGFKAVFSGPFVRSSYLADELIESFSASNE
ncbi:MAG: lipoyl synthase [Deltaproteobacteria bacterium]|nr:lipoyl synthase [Deltaproteobacteria bacterium]